MYNFKGFEYQGIDIINLESKLDAIGLSQDSILRKEHVYLYLINYLGIVTKEQLCNFANVLDSSIRISINRLNKNVEMIDVDKDNMNNTYYATNRKALGLLKKLNENVEESKVFRNKKHLSKVNDLFFYLMKSYSDSLTIEYENSLKNSSLRIDAIIKAKYKDIDYELVVEQDNNTEKKTQVYDKVYNYYNMLLKKDMLDMDVTRFYVFRHDIFMNRQQYKVCRKKLEQNDTYKMCIEKIKELENLYDKAKNCTVLDITDYHNEAFRLGVELSENKIVFLRNISYKKTKYKLIIENLKTNLVINYSSNYINNRVMSIWKAMLSEFSVENFDSVSERSIYKDITGLTWFSAENAKLEGTSILLRTNFLCGDRLLDVALNKFLFGKVNILVPLINNEMRANGVCLDDNTTVRQVFMNVGSETLCFSNLISTNIKGVDLDFILFMPTISVSDYARIEYICGLNKEEIDSSFKNDTFFIVVVTDEYSEEKYTKIVSNHQGTGSVFLVCRVNLEEDI